MGMPMPFLREIAGFCGGIFFFAAEFFKSVVHFNTMFVKIHFFCLFGKENRLKNEKEHLFLSKLCMAIS